MTCTPKAGLLPFYLKLYDDTMSERRAGFDPLLERVQGGLAQRGIEVESADVCCVASEFAAAIEHFEGAGVDAIVSLHLAYSPSMESIDALCATDLPLAILDTTLDPAFGPDVDPDRIMYNHGVHGVMDFASMLRRRGRPFEIAAGHVEASDVMDRMAGLIRAAAAARSFRRTRALRVGDAFEGMGDFTVDEAVLQTALGIGVQQKSRRDLEAAAAQVSDADIEAELEQDRARYDCDLPEEVHRRSLRVGLGLRRLLDEGPFEAFSMNFLAFDTAEGAANTVPFLEASKAMARGVGYAGEGDVLTAALVGSLQRYFGETTFTEIFCPDWRGNSLFLSHMGEINPEVAADRPRLLEKPYPFTDALNPAFVTCAPRPGPAVFADLAPGPGDRFDLILSEVDVLGDAIVEAMRNSVRAWIRPTRPIESFLETYSRNGGTHHSALMLGERREALEAFGRYAGVNVVRI